MKGTHADGEQRDGLVDTSEGGDVDCLPTDGTLGTNTGRVLSRAGVNNGVDENLRAQTQIVQVLPLGRINEMNRPG
jgi:hypothetical protein